MAMMNVCNTSCLNDVRPNSLMTAKHAHQCAIRAIGPRTSRRNDVIGKRSYHPCHHNGHPCRSFENPDNIVVVDLMVVNNGALVSLSEAKCDSVDRMTYG